MSNVEAVLAQLAADAQAADELHARSRAMLVDAVRAGTAAGLSQREIASAIGRSQPEVSRLLRFHGVTKHGKSLSAHRREVIGVIRSQGGRNPRVFGSVARGQDGESSDIDLLVDFEEAKSLFQIAELEQQLAGLLGAPVDIVTASSLRPNVRQHVLKDAIPL